MLLALFARLTYVNVLHWMVGLMEYSVTLHLVNFEEK